MKTLFLLLVSICAFGQTGKVFIDNTNAFSGSFTPGASCLVNHADGSVCNYGLAIGKPAPLNYNAGYIGAGYSYDEILKIMTSEPSDPVLYKGKTFVATIKESNTGLLVVCYPGSGEAFGPADGSQLSAINYGFDETKQWPFTIMKVQTIGTNNFVTWAEIQKYIEEHSTAAVVIGWSQGSREAMDLLLGFQGRKLSSKVKLVVAIDGPGSGNPDYSKASIVPLIIVSGKAGKFYGPLRTQERNLLEQKRNVTFIEWDNYDHLNLMKNTYTSANILSAITSVYQTQVSLKAIPIKVDSIFSLSDTLYMYTGGKVKKVMVK